MVSIFRLRNIIRFILSMTLILLIMPLSSCSKMAWTLGGTKKIDEERVTQMMGEKDQGSLKEEEDLRGSADIAAREGLINGGAAGMSGKSDLQAASNGLKKESGIEDIFFDFDKYIIRDDSMEILKKDAEWFSSNPNTKVVIEGLADDRGTTEYNLALGERRAQSVKKHLIALGVEPIRLNTISYGEEKPVCKEHTEECWWKNRKAHFTVNR
ncbi:MAG TPA: peptidoglycan-associated lipoprotein Pal [Nitrospiria bacterium]|nr:peptidoglycan-associated lipoprotein Pal [Nitrospiria bacterium]